jgi:hypothetical protein
MALTWRQRLGKQIGNGKHNVGLITVPTNRLESGVLENYKERLVCCQTRKKCPLSYEFVNCAGGQYHTTMYLLPLFA